VCAVRTTTDAVIGTGTRPQLLKTVGTLLRTSVAGGSLLELAFRTTTSGAGRAAPLHLEVSGACIAGHAVGVRPATITAASRIRAKRTRVTISARAGSILVLAHWTSTYTIAFIVASSLFNHGPITLGAFGTCSVRSRGTRRLSPLALRCAVGASTALSVRRATA